MASRKKTRNKWYLSSYHQRQCLKSFYKLTSRAFRPQTAHSSGPVREMSCVRDSSVETNTVTLNTIVATAHRRVALVAFICELFVKDLEDRRRGYVPATITWVAIKTVIVGEPPGGKQRNHKCVRQVNAAKAAVVLLQKRRAQKNIQHALSEKQKVSTEYLTLFYCILIHIKC